jgi:hypothetical protein
MTETERLLAIEEIKSVKAKYLRGVDTGDSDLVRGILAEDCVLDYNGCWVDPASGHDFMPAMNVVVHGNGSWSSALSKMGIVTVHHCHNVELEFASDSSASAIWSMTDRFFMPAGSEYSRLTGFGYYHETYLKIDGAWKIKTTRVARLRCEGA